jgi:methyl-accepting chemotaxis protein
MNISLKGKVLIPTLILILIGTISTATVSIINSKNMLSQNIIEQLNQNVGSTLGHIESWLDNRNQDIILWSGDVSIVQGVIMAQGSSIFINEMNDNLKRYNKANPFYEEIGIAHSSGSIITTSLQKTLGSNISENKSISTKDYFKQSMKGETFITRVQPSELTSKPVFIISSPIKDMADEIIGVLYGIVDLHFFTKKFVGPRKIGEEGLVYIFNKEGTIISHPDDTMIMAVNITKYNAYGQKMVSLVNGLITAEANEKEVMLAFRNSRKLGWTIVAQASVSELMGPVKTLFRINILITLLILVASAITIYFLASKISNPIQSITASLSLVGDQVLNASAQVSQSSQVLAEGATEQASSLEETSASLEELASVANCNADNAQEASNLSNQTSDEAAAGAESMQKLMNAMSGINESSQEVAKIAKGIEEIAFQTNLLALNAAVEAARAGEAGAGFAVVAEEVRSLAQRSSEQAKTTSKLITESRTRTEEGTKQATEANESLQSILTSVKKVTGLVKEITDASKEQALGIEQINMAVSKIDHVVQQNSASAEESASASGELSGQAYSMKSLVEKLDTLVLGLNKKSSKSIDEPIQQKPVQLPEKKYTPLPISDDSKEKLKPEEVIPFDDDDDDFKDF